jgi:TonB family protein
MMLREINEKWWLNSRSRSGGWRGAVVEVVVARNGTIVDKTLVRSSGNRAFDRAIIATLEQANPLPPLPGDYQPDYFRAPLRFVAPLNLIGS